MGESLERIGGGKSRTTSPISTSSRNPKIIYQEIQYFPAYSTDTDGRYLNNKGFMLPSTDLWLLAVLNSSLLWWLGWRHFPHMKDEALTPAAFRMETLPIAKPLESSAARVADIVGTLPAIAREKHAAHRALRDWLAVTWELPTCGTDRTIRSLTRRLRPGTACGVARAPSHPLSSRRRRDSRRVCRDCRARGIAPR
jgi:hypothetical protein